MYFDRFDTCEAYYLFAMGYHQGGDTTDRIFNRLHRIRFRPSPMLGCSDQPMFGLGSENAVEIYNNLITLHPDAMGIKPEFIKTEEK